jgi:hypothetical protein
MIGSRMMSLRSLLVAIAIVTLLVPQTATTAFANHQANCSEGGEINRWSGHRKAGYLHGASARLDGQSLDMCLNPTPVIEISASFAFSNIEGPGFNDIVQIGLGRCRFPMLADCTWSMEVYTGWGRTSSSPGCSGMSDVLPIATRVADHDFSTHTYKIQHASNQWHFYRETTQYLAIPESAICWSQDEATWFNESFDLGDALGGVSAEKYRISSTKYAVSEGGTFQATNFNANNSCAIGPGWPDVNGPPFFCDLTGTDNFDVWTAR